MGSHFTLMGKSLGESGHSQLCEIKLSVPGRHNVLNALAASAIARELGVNSEAIAGGLASYSGVRRRFDIRWNDEKNHRMIVDDYAHHPTEVRATLLAARQFWKGPIVTVFQPHRYTRTQHCREDFLTAFQRSDRVLISDIYSAGEEPIAGVHSETLVEELRTYSPGAEYIGDLKSSIPKILEHFNSNTLLICMGAGSITLMPDLLIKELNKK
jgi:UDP-N-acetylmuramate--alanine ligase